MAEKANLKTSKNIKNCWSVKNYTRENYHFYNNTHYAVITGGAFANTYYQVIKLMSHYHQ